MKIHYELEPGIEACGVMPLYMSPVLAAVNCPICLAALELQYV